jgi:peroxiredoxin
MPALGAGQNAPRFTLPLLQGGSFSVDEALARGPVLLAFFKISCPVCQFAMPYVERLYKAYGKSGVTVIGVSQDDAAATKGFMKEFGLSSLPIALEDTRGWKVSNDYGLTNVPTLFFIAPSGNIEVSCVGWSRADMDQISRDMAQHIGASEIPLVQAGESVPDFKAG